MSEYQELVRNTVLAVTGYDLDGLDSADIDDPGPSLRDSIFQKIRGLGYRVEATSPYCEAYHLAHPLDNDCSTCESRAGCALTVEVWELTAQYLLSCFVASTPVVIEYFTDSYRRAAAQAMVAPEPSIADRILSPND